MLNGNTVLNAYPRAETNFLRNQSSNPLARTRLEVRFHIGRMARMTRISGTRRKPPLIVVDDDDDDLHISSPRSFAQARSSVNPSRPRSRSVAEDRATAESRTSTEDLLELRLGPSSVTQSTAFRIRVPAQLAGVVDINQQRERGGSFMIDLTSPSPSNDTDCILIHDFVQKKRKPAQANVLPPEPVKELKLTCAICMDTMKEETSTICGHIFCRQCILGAIAAQKKCPTCRQKLTNNHTHRIYISGSLRNP